MTEYKTVGFDESKQKIPEFDGAEEGHIQDKYLNKEIIIKDFVPDIQVGDKLATVVITHDDKRYITFGDTLSKQLKERKQDYFDQKIMLKTRLIWKNGKAGRYLTFEQS